MSWMGMDWLVQRLQVVFLQPVYHSAETSRSAIYRIWYLYNRQLMLMAQCVRTPAPPSFRTVQCLADLTTPCMPMCPCALTCAACLLLALCAMASVGICDVLLSTTSLGIHISLLALALLRLGFSRTRCLNLGLSLLSESRDEIHQTISSLLRSSTRLTGLDLKDPSVSKTHPTNQATSNIDIGHPANSPPPQK